MRGLSKTRLIVIAVLAAIGIGGQWIARRREARVRSEASLELAESRARAEREAQEGRGHRSVKAVGTRCRFPAVPGYRPQEGERSGSGEIGEIWVHGATVTTLTHDFCSIKSSEKRPIGLPLDPSLASDNAAKEECRQWLAWATRYFAKAYKEGSCTFIREGAVAKKRVGPLDGFYFDPPCFRYYLAKVECYTAPEAPPAPQ